MHRRGRAAAAAVLAGAVLLGGCTGGQDALRLIARDELNRFGTQVRWVYAEGEVNSASVWSALTARSAAIEQDISAEDAQSSLARFNAAAAGERVRIGSDAYKLLCTAREVYEETGGAYDPATGLLVDLWGFSPRHRAADYAPVQAYDRADFLGELPAEEYIAAFSSKEVLDFSAVEVGRDEQGYYAVKLDGASVTVGGTVYTMQLNLSGIGKGYCADEAAALLREAGVTYGYYNVGSSSIALFADPTREGGVWALGVNSPRTSFASAHYATLRVRDSCIATSGDYEQYYVLDGTHYSHIIDPDTGYPAGAAPAQEGSRIVCATVVGGNAAKGDARATALCCMGLEEALAYASAHAREFCVLFVWYDGTDYTVYSNLTDWSLDEEGLRSEAIA